MLLPVKFHNRSIHLMFKRDFLSSERKFVMLRTCRKETTHGGVASSSWLEHRHLISLPGRLYLLLVGCKTKNSINNQRTLRRLPPVFRIHPLTHLAIAFRFHLDVGSCAI